MNLWTILFTGLTTGGVSCAAVQGGLLASIIANQKKQEIEEKEKQNKKTNQETLTKIDQLDWLPVAMFLSSKFITHVILGFLLGGLGAVFALNQGTKVALQIFTALFMFATAMNFLDVHPIFRHLAFQPPKFLRKIVKNSTKNQAIFAPAVLGLFSIFIPCGVTQSMEVLAIGSGSAIQGALIMGTFVIGTSPLFALLGIVTAKLTETWREIFNKTAAAILIALAIYSFNAALIVLNSPITIGKMTNAVTWFFSDERFAQKTVENQAIKQVGNLQKVTIEIKNSGYVPKYFKVKKDVPVELTVANGGTYSCASDFVFNEFKIEGFVKAGSSKIFNFTPTEKGKFIFSCSMGMYTGIMEVI